MQKRTKEALAKFQEHTHAGLHLEKLAGVRDGRVRTIRIDKFWRGVGLAPDSGDRYLLLRVMGHDEAIAWAKSRKFSVNEVSGVLEIRDIAALEELAAQATAPAAATVLFDEVKDSEMRRLGIDEQVLLLASSLVDDAHLDLVAPFLPENQSEVLYGLASGMSVEEVWSDIVAPRVPAEPIDTGDLAAATADPGLHQPNRAGRGPCRATRARDGGDTTRPPAPPAALIARAVHRYGWLVSDRSHRVGRYVRMVALPGRGQALAETLLHVADGLRDAPGCELYVVNASVDEPETVWVTEVWADADASDRALSGELGEVGIGEVLELLAGPPELVDLTPLGGTGLPRPDGAEQLRP